MYRRQPAWSMDIIFVLAVLVMVAGIAGTVIPGIPGGLLILAAFFAYWISTGFTEPGVLFAAVFTVTGLILVVTDYVAGMVSAKAGGASGTTAVVAGVLGIVLLLSTGPVGALVGVVLAVMGLEVLQGAEMEEGFRAGLMTAAGMLGSGLVQLIIATAMAVAFVAVVLL